MFSTDKLMYLNLFLSLRVASPHFTAAQFSAGAPRLSIVILKSALNNIYIRAAHTQAQRILV